MSQTTTPRPHHRIEEKNKRHMQNKRVERVLTAALTKVDVKQKVSLGVLQSDSHVQKTNTFERPQVFTGASSQWARDRTGRRSASA